MTGRYQFASMLLIGAMLTTATLGQSGKEGQIKDLLITAAAYQRMESEFRGVTTRGTLSSGERADFEHYLDQLAGRIVVKCQDLLARYPDARQTELPCGSEPAPQPWVPDIKSEQTSSERLLELELALAEGLGQFDEMLLQEQQKISSRVPRSRESGSGGGDGRGGESGSQTGQQAGDREAGRRGGEGIATGTSGNPEEGGTTGTSGGTVRSNDRKKRGEDDVVARQLREAAEKEQDPELKKKLWDEYHRYKGSTD